MAVIDYYFICSSPFAYLGQPTFQDIARRHGATVRYKPISIAGVWENSGSVPLAQRSPTRRRYRLIELQRLAEWRGLPLNLSPKHFPVDPSLADRSAAVIAEAGGDPSGFVWEAQQGVWARDENIADRDQLAAYLRAAGHDPDDVLARAEGAQGLIDRNTAEAVAADAIGAPVYVLAGEPFWGQDRLELLDRALESGRAPFTAG